MGSSSLTTLGTARSASWLAGLPAARLRWPSVELWRPRSCRCGSLIGWCCCAQAHWPRSAVRRRFPMRRNQIEHGRFAFPTVGEVIDELYERGVCICAGAGNHVWSSPPRVLVYPARYPRVIAVCGVMADGRPYADLDGVLEGSFGPASVMGQAIAAYTPNIRGHSMNEGESDSVARAPRQRHRRLPRRLPCGSKATSSGFRGTGGASRRHGTHSFPPPGRAMPRTSATASSKRIHRAKSAALGRAHPTP